MRVGDVIQALLSSNAVCVSTGSDEVFYVQMGEMAEMPDVAGALQPMGQTTFCIALADLMEAPRQLPVSCLLDTKDDEDKEECELYLNAPERYMDKSPLAELMGRLPWLLGLLFFLTVSSAILEYFDALLQRHLVIAFYLTALVGCGGNAGSQAASLVLQALATNELAPSLEDLGRVLRKEGLVALGLAAILSIGVAGRIILFGSPSADAITIAAAMALTVVFSVTFSASIPIVLMRLGQEPAKVSGPLISTVIDILGVVVACGTAALFEALGLWGSAPGG